MDHDNLDENARPGVPVEARRLAQAIQRHWRVSASALAVGALLGLTLAMLFVKPSYTAKATLLWEPSEASEASDRGFLTQIDSITLNPTLAEVKRRLRSKATLEDIREKIKVLHDGQSRLVMIEANDGSARGAAKLANTLAEAVLDYQRSLARSRGSEQLQRVEADLSAARTQQKNAEDALDAFRTALGVTNFEVELTAQQSSVSALEQQIAASQTEIATTAALEKQLTLEANVLPKTLAQGTTYINPAQQDLKKAESLLATLRIRLSEDHPDVERQVRTVEALRERARTAPSEIQDTVSLAPNAARETLLAQAAQARINHQAALTRLESLNGILASAKQRLGELTTAQPRAAQLSAAASAQAKHNGELRAARVRALDQVRSTRADFRLVTAASAPANANPSARQALVLRAPLIALLLSLLGIMLYELRGLRVHTAREAGFWANAPVIASSTWPRDQTALGALIDELSDAAPATRGTTLVVGARVNELPLAREIAYWLEQLHRGTTQTGAAEPDSTLLTTHTPSSQTALALRREAGAALTRDSAAPANAQIWEGPAHGPALRRSSRQADRVLVVVAAGTMSATELAQLRTRLGREDRIGVLLVGLSPDHVTLPDRIGEVDRFWEERAA